MDVHVTQTQRGSPDGNRVFRYLAGETYGPGSDPPMSISLEQTFVAEGWGTWAGRDTQAKDLGPAPENKMIEGAPKRKRGRPRKER